MIDVLLPVCHPLSLSFPGLLSEFEIMFTCMCVCMHDRLGLPMREKMHMYFHSQFHSILLSMLSKSILLPENFMIFLFVST